MIWLEICDDCGKLILTHGWRFLDIKGIFCSQCSRQLAFDLMRTKVGRMVRVRVGKREKRETCPECGLFLHKDGRCNDHGMQT